MGSRFPCRANEGLVYKGGNVCSQCDKCPGGHGRNTSKKVISTSRIYGDMECLECEVCPPKQYNNGGRKGCRNCLEDCAQRNRHNCSYKATQPCGECFSGFFEDYQVPDDPWKCKPCTEKEIDMFPACANFTTSTRAVTTGAIDDHNLAQNVSNTDIKKTVEMRNGHSADGITTRMDVVIGLSSLVSVVAILIFAYVIYRYLKKRRERSKKKKQKSRNPQQSASACPLLVGSSNESVKNPQVSVLGPSSDGKNEESPGQEIKVCIEDTDSAPSNDSEAVPATVDPGRWEDRRELLRLKKNIWRLCAQQWTELGNEFQVLSIPLSTVQQLKKEKEDKHWTNADFCYEILKMWTQIKGEQATVKALCDALFENGYYELIDTILLADI